MMRADLFASLRRALRLHRDSTERDVLESIKRHAAKRAIPRAVLDALGLGTGASEQDLLDAIDALLNPPEPDETPASVKKALGLSEDATEEEVVAAIKRLQEPSSASAHGFGDELRKHERLVAFAIEQAIDERKLFRSQRAWALDYASRDLEGFLELMQGAPTHDIDGAVGEFQAHVAAKVRAGMSVGDAQRDVARQYPHLFRDARDDQRIIAAAARRDFEVEGQRAVAHFMARVRELMQAHPTVSVTDAQCLVAADDPELFAAVQQERFIQRLAADFSDA